MLEDLNLKNSRTVETIQRVLLWAKRRPKEVAQPIASRELVKVFGASKNKTSAVLRGILLRLADSSYLAGTNGETGFCMKWIVSRKGYYGLLEEFRQKYAEVVNERKQCSAKSEQSHRSCNVDLKPDDPDEMFLLSQDRLEELVTLDFTYNEETKSGRKTNGWQNISRQQKPRFWSRWGLPYNYDISACAPNLIHQLALKYGQFEIVVDTIGEFVNDKHWWRQHVMRLAGLDDERDAKRLLNSLFNGARLQKSPECAAFRALGEDRAVMQRLIDDRELRRLRSAIKFCWRRIEKAEGQDLKRSSAKWSIYFREERRVLDVIESELRRQQVKYFLEHDGFRTSHEVDIAAITNRIQGETGYVLEMDIDEADVSHAADAQRSECNATPTVMLIRNPQPTSVSTP